MRTRQYLRIGVLCGAAYFITFVLGQIYDAHQPQLTGKLPSGADAYARVFLRFLHLHSRSFLSQRGIDAIISVFLIGVALGVYAFLNIRHARLARLTLAFGIASAVVQAAAAIYIGISFTTAANNYAAALTAGNAPRANTVVAELIHPSTIVQVAESIGFTLFGGVVWLGLVGVALIQVQGTRSIFGWLTIAVAILTMYPILPVMPLWCAGTAYALFKFGRVLTMDVPLAASAAPNSPREPVMPVESSVPQRRPERARRTVSSTAMPADEPIAPRPSRGTAERRSQPAPARGMRARRHRGRR